MHVELLIDVADDATYRTVVADWITSSITAVFPEASSTANLQSSLGAASLKSGGKSRSRKVSTANLEWALDEAGNGCSIWRSQEIPGMRQHAMASVYRDDEDKSFAQLILAFSEQVLVDHAAQGRVLETVRRVADGTNPAFGAIGYGGDSTRTEFEFAMRSYGAFAEYPTARRYLRGYDWTTVIPKEIVADLGGLHSLADSGAFHQVHSLASGAVMAVAMQTFAEYGDAPAGRVFKTVARALKPGLPKLREQLGVPYPRTPVVLEDAAAHGAQ